MAWGPEISCRSKSCLVLLGGIKTRASPLIGISTFTRSGAWKPSEDLELTGVCCINMDDQVDDRKVDALFETAAVLRAAGGKDR